MKVVFTWLIYAIAVIVPSGLLYTLFEEEDWPLTGRLTIGTLILALMAWTMTKISHWEQKNETQNNPPKIPK